MRDRNDSGSVTRDSADEYSIVVASAGRRLYIVDWFRDALSDLGYSGRVITTDASASSAALAAGDLAIQMPPYSSAEYEEAMMAMAREYKPRLVVSLNDYEIEYMAGGLGARLESLGIVVPGIPAELIATVTDKYACAAFLEKSGVHVPETKLGSSILAGEELAADCKEYVVKHRWGSGSSGLKIAGRRELKSAIEQSMIDAPTRAVAFGADAVVVQPRIRGTEYGIDVVGSMKANAGLVGVLARKKLRMRAGETDQAVTVDPAQFSGLGEQLYGALRPIGLIDVDVLVTEIGQASVIDINPRFGGGYPFNHIAGANVARMYIQGIAQGVDGDTFLAYRVGVPGGKYEGIRTVGTPKTSWTSAEAG